MQLAILSNCGDRVYFLKSALLVGFIFVAGCAKSVFDYDHRMMSKEECRNATMCEIVGKLTRSSDGHAWIGRLTLDSGDCVNVSLPDAQMNRLNESGIVNAKIVGSVVRYPNNEQDAVVTGIVVRGRKIGVGTCGDFFVFVEDPAAVPR